MWGVVLQEKETPAGDIQLFVCASPSRHVKGIRHVDLDGLGVPQDCCPTCTHKFIGHYGRVCVCGGSQDHCGLEIRYERKPVSKSRKFLTPQASLKLFRCFSAQRPSQRAFDFLFSDSVLLDELGRAAENATTGTDEPEAVAQRGESAKGGSRHLDLGEGLLQLDQVHEAAAVDVAAAAKPLNT